MKQKHTDPRTVLILSMLAILAVIGLTATFFLLKPAMERFSLDFYYPVLKLVRSTEKTFFEKKLLTLDRKDLAAAVHQLQQENTLLLTENAALHQLRSENTALRRIAGLNPPSRFRPVLAEVLLRDPATWQETFTIDRGTKAGIRPGNLAVATIRTSDGKNIVAVVGRILKASSHTASVATLFSRDCAIGAFLSESGTDGVLTGAEIMGNKRAKITGLPSEAKYGVGEIVVTSRFSRSFPADIYVGTIAANPDNTPAVRLDHSGMSAEAILKPAVDLARVRFVAILTETGAEDNAEK